MLERKAETLFGAMQDDGRQKRRHGLPQNDFGLTSPQLEPGWKRKRELDNAVVQERDARLDGRRHTHAIDLRQNIVGEIGLDVDVLLLRKWVGARRTLEIAGEECVHRVARNKGVLERGAIQGAPVLLAEE